MYQRDEGDWQIEDLADVPMNALLYAARAGMVQAMSQQIDQEIMLQMGIQMLKPPSTMGQTTKDGWKLEPGWVAA